MIKESIDERDLSAETGWYGTQIAKKCIQSLEKNNTPGHYAINRNAALSKILETIRSDAVVGVGDSVTLLQVGIVQALEERGSHQIINPHRKDGQSHFPETRREVVNTGEKALSADIFLTGINAITQDGKLVNIDGLGNRVAGLIFGPKRVIVVAGVNKIVPDIDSAIRRIKEVAAPINARRHYLKHGLEPPPCALTGICSDCKSPHRICDYTVIVEHQSRLRIEVVLCGESLGI